MDRTALITLSRAFDLAPLDARLDAGEQVTMEEVKAYLVSHVRRLLDQNPALLMSILYRIDVLERDVKATFAQCSPPEIPGRLADLIIERQLQKVALRARYRDV